jgi:hypothetical protein
VLVGADPDYHTAVYGALAGLLGRNVWVYECMGVSTVLCLEYRFA